MTEQQEALEDLSKRLDQVAEKLEATHQDLSDASAQQQTSSADIADQIQILEEELKELPSAVSAAYPAPTTTVTTQCDAEQPQSVRTVVMSSDKIVVGQLEHVWVEPPGSTTVARIDTGAQSSSIHAESIVEFERDGDDWVRFEVTLHEETQVLERRIKRYARVYQQADPVGTRRAVVDLRIHLGNIRETFEFTLADRSHLDYEILLGRNFLTDLALVDVGREFIQPAPQESGD